MNHALRDAHLAITAAMAGISWFVQIVHYPLFNRASRDYYPQHARLTGYLVAPIMLAELGMSITLLVVKPSALTKAGVILLGSIWLSTFLLQVPLHQALQENFTPAAHRKLVLTNWVRTVVWTARTVLACFIS